LIIYILSTIHRIYIVTILQVRRDLRDRDRGRGGRGWEERRGAQRGAEDEDGDEKVKAWRK
jgi:hypothetical protein